MGVLDLGGGRAQRAGQAALVGGLADVEPRAQVALLRPGQPGHGGRVVGALLDQRQGLQHRVVQVGGDVGPLLGADPLLALGVEVGGEPEHPRPDHERRARPRPAAPRPGPTLAWPNELPLTPTTTSAETTSTTPAPTRAYDAQPAGAEHHPDRVEPARGVEPPLPLHLVGLPPQQRDAGQPDHDRPEDGAAAERRLGDQDHADGQRGQRDRRPGVGEPADPAGPAAAAGGALRPRACRSRTAESAGTTSQSPTYIAIPNPLIAVASTNAARTHSTGTRQVARQPARDPAEQGGLGVAGDLARGARRVGGCGAHVLPRIAEPTAADPIGEDPGRTLRARGPPPGRGSGSSPMVGERREDADLVP